MGHRLVPGGGIAALAATMLCCRPATGVARRHCYRSPPQCYATDRRLVSPGGIAALAATMLCCRPATGVARRSPGGKNRPATLTAAIYCFIGARAVAAGCPIRHSLLICLQYFYCFGKTCGIERTCRSGFVAEPVSAENTPGSTIGRQKNIGVIIADHPGVSRRGMILLH